MSETTLIDVTLHDVGEGLAEAEVVEWLFAPGQAVKEDQAIVLISTDKATVELPAPASGILREQAVAVGAHVAVGALLARIEVPKDAAQKITPGVGHAPPTTAPLATAPSTTAPSKSAPPRPAPPPLARARTSDSADEVREPLSRGRLATSRAVTAAWRTVPHIVEFRQIDATELSNARQAHRVEAEREGVRLTFLPFFVKAMAITLAKHPNFNARIDMEKGEIVYRRTYHIGIASASDAGLVVPVLRDIEQMSILQVARALDALIDRSKRQALSPEEMAPGSFTITNYGSYGTWLGMPIVRTPEAGIAGFGRIQPGVLAIDGAPVVRPVLPLCVAADHRLNDGIHLAEFIDTLTTVLSTPASFDTTEE